MVKIRLGIEETVAGLAVEVMFLVVFFFFRLGREDLIQLGSSPSSHREPDGTHLHALSTNEMEVIGVVEEFIFIIEMFVAILAVKMVGMLHIMFLQALRRVKDLGMISTST